VDRQTPLWLRGWRPGLNPLQLELLDGRGEPLNPPFNSLVAGIRLDRNAPTPAWLGGPLPARSLARLLGEVPAESESEAVAPMARPIAPAAATAPGAAQVLPDDAADQAKPELKPEADPGLEPEQAGREPIVPEQPPEQPKEEPPAVERQGAEAEGSERAVTDGSMSPAATEPIDTDDGAQSPAGQPENIMEAPAEGNQPAEQVTAAESPVPRTALPAAREQANPDGTLIQPKRPSLLSGLRSRFGP